ncbi:tRNA (cytosine-5-)-methyltransferase ncl1 [Emydomyces testavorans]|uniref:tRNA (Cytosine-5-)-methyltransferase ncl1 n=1 Tax=Emydomyces testavorans TaxID=2070801 RepID=A0AAF0DAW1_9EURO|nr:tRNA (cytosine-5-)-methyltransferase ncl1 [Emydomyces testavorans]
MGKRGKKLTDHIVCKFGHRGTRPTNYAPIERHNEKFESYYNSLQIVPEDEKGQFWDALRRELPNSFRFTGSRKHALAVQERLKDFYIPNITSIRYEGELVEPPKPVTWYPDQLAWAMTTPKQVVRRFPPFASFHKFLVSETEVGNISRQEIVSMIPPLLLDVRPGMAVLDMCAAPGSKSAQLMEMIHAGEEERMEKMADKLESYDAEATHPREVEVCDLLNGESEFEDDGRSTGLLIANDSDYKRAHMLIHQMKRLNSPNLLVTNHDATMYPSIRLPPLPAADGKRTPNRYLKFDRILADVPCSGDGTTRKNISVWKDWNPANAIGLHPTQNRILVRALQMLKPGGRVVYSTCSMNPIENEAVIASAIHRCGGPEKVEIIDCSNELRGLKRSAGLASWTLMDKQGRIWNSWKDVEDEVKRGNEAIQRIAEGMFPPSAENELIDLTRCMRVYPHQQDTGGFFIAVLEKKSEIRARPEGQKSSASKIAETERGDSQTSIPAQTASSNTGTVSEVVRNGHSVDSEAPEKASSPAKRSSDHLDGEPETKRARLSDGTITEACSAATKAGRVPLKEPETAISHPTKQKARQPFEEPFKYLDPRLQEFDMIYKFYNLSPQFPRDRFMVRNAEGRPSKTIYYTTSLARDILTENEGTGLKFVHCGVKMFVKQDVQRADVCPWRIQKDGLTLLEPWIGTGRTVRAYKKETLRKLLVEMFPKVNDGGWKELGELGEWARDIDMGCCVLKLEPTNNEDGFHERMVLPLWRSLYSLNLMLPKEERRAMLLRLFNDETPLVNITQKNNAGAAQMKEDDGPEAPQERGIDQKSEIPGDVLPSREEEDAINKESLVFGNEEQDVMNARETYLTVEEEADAMNTTV